MLGPLHSLAATCRCLTADLSFQPVDCERPVEELDHPVILDFVARRRDRPTGQELIQTLAPSLQAYSLHSGRYRGATWRQQDLAVVWLLAVALHRDDDPREDAYVHFGRLHARGRLLPDRNDMGRQLSRRSVSFANSLVGEVPALRARAVQRPGEVHQATVGGRVAVRLYCEAGDPPFLYVAVSQRLRPGALSLPPEWILQLMAAFFTDAALEELEVASELATDIALAPDELCFRYFA